MEPKEVVTEFISRCDAGLAGREGGDPYALLAEGIELRIQGHTILAGDYVGREIIEKVLVGGLATRVAKARVELDSLIGDGAKVASLLRITGETIDGKVYNPKDDPGGYLFTVSGDQISQIRLFLDNTMVETVLYGRQYVAPELGEEA